AVGPGRRGERVAGAADARLVDLAAGLRVEHLQHAVVVDGVDAPAVGEGRGRVGGGARLKPRHEGVRRLARLQRDVAGRTRLDGEQRAVRFSLRAGADEEQAVTFG